MYERIMQIIVYVMSQLQQGDKPATGVSVDELLRRGYTNAEISTAFSWIADKMELSREPMVPALPGSPLSYRILHEAERENFTPAAWGALVQYHQLGLITTEHIEQIIERAMLTNFHKTDVPELNIILVSLLFQGAEKKNSMQRLMLSANEQIH
jgi:uncharacterized protein Smg (DUF494 family)